MRDPGSVIPSPRFLYPPRPLPHHPRPLRQVYPWKAKPKEKQMTIAAGFFHRDGILLCAHTEHQIGGEFKTHESKLTEFECVAGRVEFAFAGNDAFAVSAIEECERKLKQTSSKDALTVVRAALDAEYKRIVLTHPEQAFNVGVHYWLLFAVWQ